jgi:hypothetical protein
MKFSAPTLTGSTKSGGASSFFVVESAQIDKRIFVCVSEQTIHERLHRIAVGLWKRRRRHSLPPSSRMSSAAANGPLARSWLSRHLNVIATSRALQSAALLLL